MSELTKMQTTKEFAEIHLRGIPSIRQTGKGMAKRLAKALRTDYKVFL
jgi:hypothetical protein